MPPSGSIGSHAYPHRQTVRAVHQANGKCRVANFFRAEMIEQQQIDVVFGVSSGNLGDRFNPRQRHTFLLAEMVTHPPACQCVQFGLSSTGFAQYFTVHFQTKGAAVDL